MNVGDGDGFWTGARLGLYGANLVWMSGLGSVPAG